MLRNKNETIPITTNIVVNQYIFPDNLITNTLVMITTIKYKTHPSIVILSFQGWSSHAKNENNIKQNASKNAVPFYYQKVSLLNIPKLRPVSYKWGFSSNTSYSENLSNNPYAKIGKLVKKIFYIIYNQLS